VDTQANPANPEVTQDSPGNLLKDIPVNPGDIRANPDNPKDIPDNQEDILVSLADIPSREGTPHDLGRDILDSLDTPQLDMRSR